jgi:hypothetical protein
MGAGDVTVLVVGVLLAVLGAATDLIVTWAGAMADTLGGWCRTNAGSVGCRYLGVWLYGPWVGLTLAVVVGIVLGHRRWARGRGTWPVLPIGLALYLPLVVLSILALS